MTDTPTPASDDLTPEVLAGIGALWKSTGIIENSDMRALLSGVRSRDARIAELENEMERDVAKMSRITELEDARDEVQEKIAYLRRNCMGMEWQQLVQKIGAVGSAEWARGYYWNTLVAEHRDKQVAAEVAQRTAERRVAELEAEIAARDAVIADALAAIGDADEFIRLRAILSAAPSLVLAARDARIAELQSLLASNHRAYLSAIGADQ